jgi:hypothetical protein
MILCPRLAKHPDYAQILFEQIAVRIRMSRLSFPAKLFLGFAACSYGWTVLLDFAPHSWQPAPILVFLLCPACLLTITVDPSLTTVAFVLAPINAFLYGLFGLAVGKVLTKVSEP